MMTPLWRLIAPGVALGLVLTGLATASPAAAAPGGVEVSPDGVSYNSTYSGALFTSLANLVPGDNDESLFYLRNSSTEPGFLRITLRDVVTSNSDFANALNLGVSTPGHVGTPVTILEANPCWVLLEGQVVAPGEVVRVTTSLSLGDLRGQAGQGATANAALSVALTGTVQQLPPTECGRSGTVLPVVPQQPARPSMSGVGGSGAAAEGDAPPTAAGSPDTDLPVLNVPEFLGIDPNTWRLFEEYLVLVLIGASVLGGAVFLVVRRWSKKAEAETLV
ncbi:hypothetical protein ACX3O0_01995 [Homoserinimonas sp. A447]